MAKKLTGDLAQTSVGGPAIPITGTTSVGSPTLTAVSSTTGIAVGAPIVGPGIPNGTTVLTVGSGTLTLSANATVAGTAVSLVANEMQVLGLRGWSLDVKLATPDASTTDDFGWKSSLPSAKEWSGKATFVYLQGDPSQTIALKGIITALINSTKRWNFFPDPVNADDCYYGNCFVESVSFGAKMGEVVTYEVGLKGDGPLYFSTEIAPAVTATITGLQAEV